MRPKAKKNLAKTVETKERRIDIPNAGRAELLLRQTSFNAYLAGIVAGLGIKGRWSFDQQQMQIIVEDDDGK